MRKLLLASTAALGASLGLAGYAQAQTTTYTTDPSVTTGPVASPYPNSIGRYVLGAPAKTGGNIGTPPPTIAPGNIVVRLGGLQQFIAGYVSDNDANTAGLAGTGATGGSKVSPYQFGTLTRLYPSFEAVAANGLKYGAFIELRTDAGGGAGGGVYGSPSGTNANRGEVYVRRSFGYLGTPQFGTLRFGGTDQPTSLFLTGTFENFDSGGWNGDLPSFIPGNIAPVWPFEDVGSLYSTIKVEYLSPQMYGFDFGVSYQPNTGTPSLGSNCNTSYFRGGAYVGAGQGVAGAGCDALSSTGTGDYSRPKNIIDAVLRYRGTFGPVGVAATGGGFFSAKVRDSATPERLVQYDGFAVGDAGLVLSYGPFSAGGHFTYGRFNNNNYGALLADGAPSGLAWLAGASYYRGPLAFGASYFNVKSAGDINENSLAQQITGARVEQGIAVGGSYALAPGFALQASYIWGQRKESGYNFVTGSDASTGVVGSGLNAMDHNKVSVQGVGINTAMSW